MSIHKLQEMLSEARNDIASDTEYWAREGCGQESDQAEESGRLIGYAEGLEAAIKLMKENARECDQLRSVLRDMRGLVPVIISNASGIAELANEVLSDDN